MRTREDYRIAERAIRAFLRACVRETYRKKCEHLGEILRLKTEFEGTMDSVDYDKVTRLSHAAVEKTHAQCKRRHVSKLEALLSRSKKLELCPEGQAHWVVNLSKHNLTPSQEEVLKIGLNFAPVPTKFSLQDTIAGMEETARKLPKEDADDLWMRVCGIFRSSKLLEDNISSGRP